jgi:hypothetical protein
MRRAALFLFIAAFLLSMSGCGSQPSVTTPPSEPSAATAQVSLTVTDAPPAGVTVLFFQLSITGASLSPGGVSLLSGSNPIPVNVSQLQTDSAFLSTANVPAGTYDSLSLTFSPSTQLTIYNGSGTVIGSGANACANNTVCQLTPSPSDLSLTFNTSPFPVTLTAGTTLALKLDIHLDKVIQPDLTVNLAATNGVTISQMPAPPAGEPNWALGRLIGTIQSVNSVTCALSPSCPSSFDDFTLQTGDGRTFTIRVNSSTTYSYPSPVCSTDSFACLATGQVVKVEVSLSADGNLIASEVDYVQPAGQTVVEGNVIRLSTSGGNTLMDLILQQGPPTPIPDVLRFGQRVTVTVPPTGVTYAVDSGSFTIPNGMSFASAENLFVGQEVSVVVQGSVTTAPGSGSSTPWGGPAVTTFTTNSITLEPSQITGSVQAVSTSTLSFGLSTNPNYFVPPSGTAGIPPTPAVFPIKVQTTSGTTFTNFTPDSISGLAVNDVVSVGGWLFLVPDNNNVCNILVGCGVYPMIAAQSVVGRSGPTPLF